MILLNTFESQKDDRARLFQLLKLLLMVYGFDFGYFEVEEKDTPTNVEILKMFLLILNVQTSFDSWSSKSGDHRSPF